MPPQLLSAVDGIESVELELKLILKAFVDQKALLTLPEAVDFLVDVFLSFALDSCVYTESVQDILSGGQRSSREEREQQLLNKILGENVWLKLYIAPGFHLLLFPGVLFPSIWG